MEDCLGNVGAENEAEEDDKEVCGGKTRTKGPQSCLQILESWQLLSG